MPTDRERLIAASEAIGGGGYSPSPGSPAFEPSEPYASEKSLLVNKLAEDRPRNASGPLVNTARFRGEALCDCAVIYGAEDRAGVRQGRIVIEQLPDRSALRVRLLGFDSEGRRAGAEMLLDAEGFQGIAKVFQGYGNEKIDRPTSKKDTSERIDDVVSTLQDLSGADAIPLNVRESIAAAALSILRAQTGEPERTGRRRMDLADLALPDPPMQATAPPEPEL